MIMRWMLVVLYVVLATPAIAQVLEPPVHPQYQQPQYQQPAYPQVEQPVQQPRYRPRHRRVYKPNECAYRHGLMVCR
jgi:hypothetical protein